MTQVLSHARKFTCAVVLNVRGFGEVFPPPVARKGIAIACKRHTLHFSNKNCSSQLDADHHLSDCCHHDEDELDNGGEGHLSIHFSGQFVLLLH